MTPQHLRARGRRALCARVDRGVGLAASGAIGLLAAWWCAPTLARVLVERLAVDRLAERVAYDRSVGTTQFFVYVLSLALVCVCAIGFAFAARDRSRGSPTKSLPSRPTAIAVALAIAAAPTVSLGALLLVVVALPLVGLALGAFDVARVEPRAPEHASPSIREAQLTLGAAAIALSWGALLTFAPMGRAIASAAALTSIALSAAFVVFRVRGRDPTALARDAAASTPLLPLPLLGLLRAPSPLWLAAALAACVVLRAIVRARAFVPRGGAALLAMTLSLMVVVPMRLRDLPTPNHFEHEAHHFAWINSALGGKLLMADAATIYPPLREYVLTAALAITGATLEHARIAMALVNVAALGAMIAVIAHLARGRHVLVIWGAYLLLACTPLRAIIHYRTSISLGWADLARVAVASVAVVGALESIVTRRLDRAWRWGVVTALSILYSHEFGLCALGSIVLAGGFDLLVHRAPASSRVCRADAARALGGYLLGVVAPLALVISIYAAFGKARLFLSTFFDFLFLLAVGVQQASPFPVDHAQLVSPRDLLSNAVGGGLRLEYLVPPLVYVIALLGLVAALVLRRWRARDSMRLGLLLFGATSYRVALQRSDVFHLVLAAAPAALLAVHLGGDLLALARRHRAAVAPLVVAIAASVWMAESQGLVYARLVTTLAGDELPSRGPPYRHDDVPRAGDVSLPSDVEALVRFVRAHAAADAPVFCRIGFMSGAELYFLADRQNPTRFDALAEVITFAQREELARELSARPPALVIGSEVDFIGPEAARWIAERYHPIASFAGVAVLTRNDASTP